MKSKGMKFRLYKRGYPENSDTWFSYDDAVKYEESFFNTAKDAQDAMIALCIASGTVDDPNYDTGRPLVLSEPEFIELMGSDEPFSWY